MTVTSRVRHIIEITINQVGQPPAAFEFESRDIGCTQGTTIRHGDIIIGRYRPGTRHWDVALNTAEQVLAQAMIRATTDSPWTVDRLVQELATVLAEQQCTPWDGDDPNYDKAPW